MVVEKTLASQSRFLSDKNVLLQTSLKIKLLKVHRVELVPT